MKAPGCDEDTPVCSTAAMFASLPQFAALAEEDHVQAYPVGQRGAIALLSCTADGQPLLQRKVDCLSTVEAHVEAGVVCARIQHNELPSLLLGLRPDQRFRSVRVGKTGSAWRKSAKLGADDSSIAHAQLAFKLVAKAAERLASAFRWVGKSLNGKGLIQSDTGQNTGAYKQC